MELCPMTYHVVSLPHTQTTAEYSNCAFTQNVRGFIKIANMNHHDVILYGSEEVDVPVKELVTCMSRQEQVDLMGVSGPETVLNLDFRADREHWILFNKRVSEGIRVRQKEGDVLCIIAGDCNATVVDEFQYLTPVEFAVGYTNVVHNSNRIWASYAWMHACFGHYYGAHGVKGRFYDRVIHHYLDLNDFQYREDKDDYFLFIGRLNEDKGIGIATQVAQELGVRLVVAGQGQVPNGVDYRGRVGIEERAELLAGARATFVPSLYMEPFGLIAIESLASGTPVISTDWGGLSEIVTPGTGFKCYSYQDFLDAAKNIDQIAPADCRARGEEFSLEKKAVEYEAYFRHVDTLRHGGWYAKR